VPEWVGFLNEALLSVGLLSIALQFLGRRRSPAQAPLADPQSSIDCTAILSMEEGIERG
jgi:hypothetical protein